jgi:hypothetical protein
LWNVLLIGSIASLATTLVAPWLGPPASLGVYAAIVIVQQAAPGVESYLPLARVGDELPPHCGFSGFALLIAVLIWTITLGRSRLAHRLSRYDRG